MFALVQVSRGVTWYHRYRRSWKPLMSALHTGHLGHTSCARHAWQVACPHRNTSCLGLSLQHGHNHCQRPCSNLKGRQVSVVWGCLLIYNCCVTGHSPVQYRSLNPHKATSIYKHMAYACHPVAINFQRPVKLSGFVTT